MSLLDFTEFQKEHGVWSDKTFGKRTSIAPLHHLLKEVNEVIIESNQSIVMKCDDSVGIGEYGRQLKKEKQEYADCLLLLMDSARLSGFNMDDIFFAAKEKFEINKQRQWGKPDENGVVEHIK